MMENRLDIRSRFLAMSHDLEVLPYSSVIVDAHGIEVFQPLTSDELPVGLYKFYPLLVVECRRKFRIRHLLHFAKGADHLAHNFDSGEVHRFTEMGVENTGYITTFVVTLGFVTHCL